MHERDVCELENPNMMTKEEKKKSLKYLMFLNQKQCRKTKGRGYADWRKKRVYKMKQETSSPNVRTESILLSCVINAKENRYVATYDIPVAFM